MLFGAALVFIVVGAIWRFGDSLPYEHGERPPGAPSAPSIFGLW